MKSHIDKKCKELVTENYLLTEKIKALKMRLHEKFFSSMKNVTLEDYELIIEQETDAIFKGNQTGDFILVNDFASKLTGYSEDELLNLNMRDLFRSDVLTQKPLRYDIVLKGKSVKKQRPITKKDGSSVMVEMISKKLSDGSLISVMRDISREDELQSALKQSEEKFREIFDNAADIMVLYKLKTEKIPVVSDVNNAALKVLGYSKNELIGEKISVLFEGNTKREYINFLTKVMQGKRVIYESKYIRKDGTVFPVEVSGKLIKIGKEKFIHSVFRNISERLKIQNQIKASEEKYRLLFEMLPYGGEVLNTKGIITDVSPGTASMLGYKKEELIGMHIRELMDKDSEELHKETLPNILKGEKQTVEICFLKKDGSKVNVIRAGQPIYNNAGTVESILSLSIDITKRKKIEKALLEKNKIYEKQNKEYILLNEELGIAKEKAEESNRLKTAFLANMSHEIRTPMNGILGFSQLLTMPGLSEIKIKEYSDIIMQSGKHLLNIINDIIDISKIDAGQLIIYKSPVNINFILKEIYSFFHSYKTGQGKEKIDLKLNVGLPDNNAVIVTDETRLRQILSNLLNNAFKFTEKGFIEFGYKVEENQLAFYIKDSGIGIEKKEQSIIFTRFMQGNSDTEKLYGGTGLGLSISKACTQLLGGEIRVESEPNKGSTFYFTIPYEKAFISTGKVEILQELKFTGQQILIVEDDPVNYEYISEILSDYDLKFKHVETANDAIDSVKEQDFDLVLMDIQLPGKNGNYATEEIKKIRPELPVIAQSAYVFEDEKQKSFEAGCDDYIIKPIKSEELLIKIKNMLLNIK